MPTVFDSARAAALRSRIDHLTSATPRLWGKMSAHQMLCHVGDSLRVPLGEIPVTPKANAALRFLPLRWLIIHALPIPHGKAPTTPEFQTTRPTMWAQDLAQFKSLLDRLTTRGPGSTYAVHPAFGRMKGADWGVLIYKHLDHHFRQFGI